MRLMRMKPFYFVPRISWILAGYKGFDRGLGLMWFGILITIIKPSNERK